MVRRLIAVLAITCVAIGSSRATTEIRLSSNPAGTINCISAPGPEFDQLKSFHVVIVSDAPLTSVSFSLSIPPPVVWIDETSDFAGTVGTSPTGITIPFGGCLSGTIHAMTVRYVVFPWNEERVCQFAFVLGAVGHDCSGQAVNITVQPSRVVPGSCEIEGPSNPAPADHDRDVPLGTVLNWTGAGAQGCALGELLYYSLYFGTDPNPPYLPGTAQVAYPGMAPPQPLVPGTQYYWRVLATQYSYNSVLSPVWTFTTAGAVPTHPTTWGSIKALYR